MIEHAFDDGAGLIGFIPDRDDLRLRGGLALGAQVLGEALARKANDAIGSGKDRLRRTIVAVQRDDGRRRRELRREIEDVAHGGGAKRIDRLRVVADHRQTVPLRLQCQQDGRLQAVGVLIFVHQNMIETPADMLGECGLAGHLRPVQQQVVVIEHVLFLLGLDIASEQIAQFRGPAGAPREVRGEHLFQRQLRIDATRINRDAGTFGGEAALGFGEAELVPDQIHEVRGILAVVNRESRIEADLFGIVAQQARADAVKGAGPGQRVGHHSRIVADHLAGDALDAARHLAGGAARKRHQQDAARVGAIDDQMRDPVRQRIGLAGTSTGDHQQRRRRRRIALTHAVFHGRALFGIEAVEIGGRSEQGNDP